MSWTSSEIIKKHLFDLDRLPTEYNDVAVRFDAAGKGLLPHKGLVTSSVKVKRLADLIPAEQSGVTLNGETWVQLNHENLFPGEIVVAADSDLDTVYETNKDFVLDAVTGKIRRIASGSIGEGAVVEVYYLRYEVMTESIDYTIDYDSGEITVVVGGSLEPETTVWVDYQISSASGSDQLIDEAITVAEDKILSLLKDEYDASSDEQGIETGATELTLSIICRGLTSQALGDGKPSAEGRARGWRELAIQFETSAWFTLRPYLHTPQLMKGAKRSNQSWEWS